MCELLIREATVEDATEMIEYLNCVGGESDNLMHGLNEFQISLERIKSFISAMKQSSNSTILISLIDNKIIARASLEGYPNKRTKHRAKFSISVKKEFWNQGIGKRMLEKIIEAAKAMQIRIIELEVLEENKNAIALYTKMGFEVTGTYRDYFFVNGEYKNALLMNLIV
jgi:RimJ/RimL family protein N-acetyltransferase